MPNNNDKKDSGSSKGFIPSDRFEKYTGPNKEIRDQYAKWQRERESSKPNTQFGNSSVIGAGSSKGKS
ncbi:MAG: hypothetical protein ACR5KX_00310 [Wolbachia sp.]